MLYVPLTTKVAAGFSGYTDPPKDVSVNELYTMIDFDVVSVAFFSTVMLAPGSIL